MIEFKQIFTSHILIGIIYNFSFFCIYFKVGASRAYNRQMPPTPVNTLHCLILQSKLGLKEIPQGVIHYFINSKRRFFLYFRLYEQMIETMRILTQKNIRFYRRQSLFPDREEYEEHVYHCNYRFKKQDLRKNLYHSTPYNEPKMLFDKYEEAKDKFQLHQEAKQDKKEENSEKQDVNIGNQSEKVADEQEESSKKKQLENDDKINSILNNKKLLVGIFEALNIEK